MIVSALHLAPAATPAPVVTRLNAAINASRAAPELRASLAKLGYEPKRTSPEKFADVPRCRDAQVAADRAGRWSQG